MRDVSVSWGERIRGRCIGVDHAEPVIVVIACDSPITFQAGDMAVMLYAVRAFDFQRRVPESSGIRNDIRPLDEFSRIVQIVGYVRCGYRGEQVLTVRERIGLAYVRKTVVVGVVDGTDGLR